MLVSTNTKSDSSPSSCFSLQAAFPALAQRLSCSVHSSYLWSFHIFFWRIHCPGLACVVWMINDSSLRRKMLTDSVAKILVLFLSDYSSEVFLPLCWWARRRRSPSSVWYGDPCLLWTSLVTKRQVSFQVSSEINGLSIIVHLVGNVLEMWDDGCQGSQLTLKKIKGTQVARLPCGQRYCTHHLHEVRCTFSTDLIGTSS